MELAVLLTGTLRGLDRIARCEVLATRRTGARNSTGPYTQVRMLKAPYDWPEAEYVLELNGRRMKAVFRQGHWFVGEISSTDISTPAEMRQIA